VKPYKPTFKAWWLSWMVLRALFFYTVAYEGGF
jgi:hypothetical protein